jgi:hypothetical protein
VNGDYIFVDFQKTDEIGRLRLNTIGARSDIERLGLTLFEGLQVKVYNDDTDDDGNEDNLIANGIIRRNATTGEWVVEVDRAAVQHESDGPL